MRHGFAVALATLVGCGPGETTSDGTDAGSLHSEIVIIVKVTGDGRDVRLEVPLPRSNEHQTLVQETLRLRGFSMAELVRDEIRSVELTYPALTGNKRFTYKALVRTRISQPGFTTPPPGVEPPPALHRWTTPTRHLPSRNPAVRERLIRYAEPKLEAGNDDLVRLVYDLVSMRFQRRTGEDGTASVLEAVRTSKANDRGLNRLFVTFLRTAGIPAREVGGLRLTTEHGRNHVEWAEVHLEGKWVPFGVAHGWYGKLPADILQLYHGDRPFIRRQGVSRVRFRVLVRRPQAEVTQ